MSLSGDDVAEVVVPAVDREAASTRKFLAFQHQQTGLDVYRDSTVRVEGGLMCVDIPHRGVIRERRALRALVAENPTAFPEYLPRSSSVSRALMCCALTKVGANCTNRYGENGHTCNVHGAHGVSALLVDNDSRPMSSACMDSMALRGRSLLTPDGSTPPPRHPLPSCPCCPPLLSAPPRPSSPTGPFSPRSQRRRSPPAPTPPGSSPPLCPPPPSHSTTSPPVSPRSTALRDRPPLTPPGSTPPPRPPLPSCPCCPPLLSAPPRPPSSTGSTPPSLPRPNSPGGTRTSPAWPTTC
mmetsp:Transcript_35865/g.89497  ORF Transcript_35865/g.89497 Transcript_35865/m.89497 type:complete len:296 (-) Transcript_35865:786-1673(-)